MHPLRVPMVETQLSTGTMLTLVLLSLRRKVWLHQVVRNTETMDLIGIKKAIADLGKKLIYSVFISFSCSFSNSHIRLEIISLQLRTWLEELSQLVTVASLVP